MSTTKGLPRIALDPLAEAVAEIEIKGKTYPVMQVTGIAYQGAVEIQNAQARGEAPDPEVIFRTARALVPSLPPDVDLNVRQSMAVIFAASDQVKAVEALYPKAKGGGSRPRVSRPRTR